MHELHTHHASRDAIVKTVVDRFGNVHVLRGLGFRGPSLYEEIAPAKTVVRGWIQRWDGTHDQVLWEVPRRKEVTTEELLRVRDAAFRDGTVVVWVGNTDGEGQVVFESRPERGLTAALAAQPRGQAPARPVSKAARKKAMKKGNHRKVETPTVGVASPAPSTPTVGVDPMAGLLQLAAEWAKSI